MYALTSFLVDPFLVLMLVLGTSLALAWRRGCLVGKARPWVGGAYLLLYLAGVTPTSSGLLALLEGQHPAPSQWENDAGAVVVLSGAFLPPAATRPKSEPAFATLMRCLHAAEVYRQRAAQQGPDEPLPLLLSGGLSGGDQAVEPDAVQMARLMEQFQVPRQSMLLEDRSTTTFENARQSAEMLRERGIGKVILVTDAVHMPRAVQCFRKQGIEVQPAPCNFRSGGFPPLSLYWILPTLPSLTSTQIAQKELVGIAWYWLKGRI